LWKCLLLLLPDLLQQQLLLLPDLSNLPLVLTRQLFR
jgi:hypothetical protein